MPALALAVIPMFTSCETDNNSNPTLQEPTSFVLNTPSDAANTYDLINADSIMLTCSQPDYGGFPAGTTYTVEVSLDPNFASSDTAVSKTAVYSDLATPYYKAKMFVNSSEFNDSVVALYMNAHDGAAYPENVIRSVYIRLKACITSNPTRGICYSNVITLPNVLATYVAPKATLPTELYVVGSSIQTAWSSWKLMPLVYGITGQNQFYTMIYCPANAEFKWGTKENDWRGYSDFKTINDNAGAGLTKANGGNIIVATAGWYVVHIVSKIVSGEVQYTLNFDPGEAYVIGAVAGGTWTDTDPAWKMTAPSDATGKWESPAFTGAGELRAYIKVAGIPWWRTEFTIVGGKLFFRNANIPSNWATDVGSDYSVGCAAGQKLYVDFDNNTAEVN